MLRRTFLLAPTLALPVVAQEKTMEEKNAEARLFQAETRAGLARTCIERFLLPIDAWIQTGGPGKAIPNIDAINNKQAPDVAPWFLLLIETVPRAMTTPREYRFCLDTAKRKLIAWGVDYEQHESSWDFPETLQGYAQRIRDNLLTYLVDDLARASNEKFYKDRNKLDFDERIEQDAEVTNVRRLLQEGEGHLYPLVQQDTPIERAALKEFRLY